jgi:signal transduction histidine kinase
LFGNLAALALVALTVPPVQWLALVWLTGELLIFWFARTPGSQRPDESSSTLEWVQHDSTLHDLSNAMTASMFTVRDITRALEKGTEAHTSRALLLSKELSSELAQLSDHINASRQSVRPQLAAATPVSLLPPVRQSVDQVSRLFPEVHFDIDCVAVEPDAIVNVSGGEATLKRIVENLLLNAGQAQNDTNNKQVKCHIEVTDSSVILRVSDNGPGFPSAVMSKHPSPLISTKSGGSGMGLYSCHQLVHRDGGDFILANADRGGACVTAIWPRGDSVSADPFTSATRIKRSGTRAQPSNFDLLKEAGKRIR